MLLVKIPPATFVYLIPTVRGDWGTEISSVSLTSSALIKTATCETGNQLLAEELRYI